MTAGSAFKVTEYDLAQLAVFANEYIQKQKTYVLIPLKVDCKSSLDMLRRAEAKCQLSVPGLARNTPVEAHPHFKFPVVSVTDTPGVLVCKGPGPNATEVEMPAYFVEFEDKLGIGAWDGLWLVNPTQLSTCVTFMCHVIGLLQS